MGIKAEKIKCNKTPATVFVGVGGIGSRIVARVAGKCVGTEADNIRFVVMDTDVNDLTKVQTGSAVITTIQTSSTQSVGAYLEKDDAARNHWFPKNSILYPKTVSEGAGQVRAISRLALNSTIKSGEIQKLYSAIDELFLKDGRDLKQALRVVVVSTVAGGTGSGIAMIVGMLIRRYVAKNYPETASVIRGMLLLPGVMDTVIKTETERDSQRRNGYAAIKEINAFMMKGSGFFGVENSLARYHNLHIDVPSTTGDAEALDLLPFDFCFLMDRTDENQGNMDKRYQYEESAAQSLYEQNIGPMQQLAFSQEDNIIKEICNRDNLGRNRFGSIGSAVLRYPYDEVADYIAFNRAIERIGGTESADNWLKYDKEFKHKLAEYKKKKAGADKRPDIGEVYVSAVNNGEDRFSKELRRFYLTNKGTAESDVTREIMQYLEAFTDEIVNSVSGNPEIASADAAINELKQEIDYSNDSTHGHASENKNKIRNYEKVVKSSAATIARGRSEAIFYNSESLRVDSKPYAVERLLKTVEGGMHPNAIRYVLYLLRAKFRERYNSAVEDKRTSEEILSLFSAGTSNPDEFDLKFTGGNSEANLDQACEAEKEDPGLFERLGGHDKIYKKYNEWFPNYANQVVAYRDAVSIMEACEMGYKYVAMLCEELEKFYNSFEMKVINLRRAQTDIIESLKFDKGDSVLNVCASEECVEELIRMAPEGEDGLMLPPELNADIFDAVKRNVGFRRESEYDQYIEDKSADVFDDVVIDYFRQSVRQDCAEVIDMDIISALAEEYKINCYIKAKEEAADDDEIVLPKVDDAKKAKYIASRIQTAERLAAPGIGAPKWEEPREVAAYAYHRSLNDARNNNIRNYISSEIDTDTISKYEIHFFKALYNITPDKLPRFCAPNMCETNKKTAGLYYNAYHSYMKRIGPDSTKSMVISPHIDKRWDSIAELPEIDITDQYEEMLRIHVALIYGLVHGMIRCRPSSRHDKKKGIFKLEDSDGEMKSLVVSNGTECDEFYEVLDALYRDRASVEIIASKSEEKRKNDIEKNPSFDKTVFASDVADFRLGSCHDSETSLFEIPLTYYNSLPNKMRDNNELSIMVDAIIRVLRKELERFDQPCDIQPHLCQLLEYHFRLLIKNFNELEVLRKNSTADDNIVMNIIFKKIKLQYEDAQPSDFSVKINELKALIKGSAGA